MNNSQRDKKAREYANKILNAIGYKTHGRWNRRRWTEVWIKDYKRLNSFNYKLVHVDGDIWKVGISDRMMFTRSCEIVEIDMSKTVTENVDLHMLTARL